MSRPIFQRRYQPAGFRPGSVFVNPAAFIGDVDVGTAALLARHHALLDSLAGLHQQGEDQIEAIQLYQEGFLDEAEMDNSAISASEVFEVNEQDVNALFLETVAIGIDTFTETQITALLAIADQCPLAGGDAVFKARSLYSLVDPLVKYEDEERCASEPEERAMSVRAFLILLCMKSELKKIGVLFLLGLPLLVIGQKHDCVWMFGYNSNATLNFPGVEGVILSFNEIPLSVEYIQTTTNITVSNATIADTYGSLLFYTNGCQIANGFHQIMDNGDSLNFGEVFNVRCNESAFGYPAGPQSCLILPVPGNSDNYLVFHDKIEYVYEPEFDVITFSLLFTRVNVLIDQVIEKNIPVIQDTISAGQLTAVKQSNGIDWWVIVPQYLSNKYYCFELTGNGIENLSEQQIGNPTVKRGEGGGQAVFSPDGTKYVRYTPADGLFIFDFDRNIGQLSNFRFIAIDDGAFTGGVAVSPSSRYLYVCSEDFVYQFDLLATDIEASRITVAEYDGYQSPFPTKFFNAQLAPDCKIYINSFATVDVLHVIHNPDEPGLACNFEQHAVQLPFNHARSLPHFPNYRLGPLVEGETPPPPCEPVVSTEEVRPTRQKAYVFPNPAPGYFKVVFEQALLRPGRVVLYNGLGQVMLEEVLGAGSREFRLEVGGIPPGLYFYSVFLDGQVVKAGKLVVAGGR